MLMYSSKYLHAHIASKQFYMCNQFNINYQSRVRKYIYHAQTSRCGFNFADYQLARFSADPCED